MSENPLHERPFQKHILEYLLSKEDGGYQKGRMSDYNYKYAFDTAKLVAFLDATQPKQLEKFRKTYGNAWEEELSARLHKRIEQRGLMETLRKGYDDYISGATFRLVYFKPNQFGYNEHWDNYRKNVFSVTEEFAYEEKEDSHRVDLAVFLNGIPIIMIELKKKTAGQRAVYEGTEQFRNRRNPEELVFKFNKRTLVFFSMDEDEVYMTTKLNSKNTIFLPFNKGYKNGAGNPLPEYGDYSTCYLWEEVLAKDTLLRILRDFMFVELTKDEDTGAVLDKTVIFPRYHQFDCVNKVEEHYDKNGIGHRYLIQHSAGSGKTKTIGWLAFRLLNKPDINSVVVISDRNVIDKQLQEAVAQLETQKGTVARIDENSQQLLKELESGDKIVVTTLQKFPFVLEQFSKKPDKKYAVIIDEAHSSTSGKTMAAVGRTLASTTLEGAIAEDTALEESDDGQDRVNRTLERLTTNNISFFAFTATPKQKTLEMFGKPRENEPGKEPFHLYSMKQAIEEGFILNVLKSYTSYKQYFKISKLVEDSPELDAGRAAGKIMNYVSLDDTVIEAKSDIIIEDFWRYRRHWMKGLAKAMVVSPSRRHAVRYYKKIREIIEKKGYSLGVLVAFTGEIDGHTESELNGFSEAKTRKEFKKDDNRIMIVADKFQTGFDEPKLCVMYVDKTLKDVKAVQTLSRLNRAAKGKRNTFVLDFVNPPEVIQEAFARFYEDTYIQEVLDPDEIFVKKAELDSYNVYTQKDVDEVCQLLNYGDKKAGPRITFILRRVADKVKTLEGNEEIKLFKSRAKKFSEMYIFLFNAYGRGILECEKTAEFLNALVKYIGDDETPEDFDPAEFVRLDVYNVEKSFDQKDISLRESRGELEGLGFNAGVKTKVKNPLDEIIERLNEKYAAVFLPEALSAAKESVEEIINDIASSEDTLMMAENNSRDVFRDGIREKVYGSILDRMLFGEPEAKSVCEKLIDDEEIKNLVANAIVNRVFEMLHVS
ncbi:MAG: DEAD/DEAH box helicase family protein [Clostridia bacterium]|nr:DEAD/DEAH box helicase family protein [Clostridia bacterium]